MKYSLGLGLALELGVVLGGGLAALASEQADSSGNEKQWQAHIGILKDKKAAIDKRIAACVALQDGGGKAMAALAALIEVLQDNQSIPKQIRWGPKAPSTMRSPQTATSSKKAFADY